MAEPYWVAELVPRHLDVDRFGPRLGLGVQQFLVEGPDPLTSTKVRFSHHQVKTTKGSVPSRRQSDIARESSLKGTLSGGKKPPPNCASSPT